MGRWRRKTESNGSFDFLLARNSTSKSRSVNPVTETSKSMRIAKVVNDRKNNQLGASLARGYSNIMMIKYLNIP